jgi:hypothetical protein
MRRFVTLAVLFLFSIPFGISISGCGKKASITYCSGDSGPIVGQAVSIALTPQLYGLSLNFGEIGQVATPTAIDCKGNTVTISSYTYGVFDANGIATMSIADVEPTGTGAGKLCGGTWNRNSGGGIADFTTCNATNNTGEVFVVASASGVSSNPIPIYVHPVVTSVVLGNPSSNCSTDQSSNCCPIAGVAPISAPAYTGETCLSQGQTGQIVVRAFDAAGNNITCPAGHFTYTPQASSIVSIDQNGIATALQPGSTVITANISNAGSSAGFFSTCPPASIALTAPGSGSGSATNVVVNQNVTQPLSAIVTDTQGNNITGLSLTYESTQPNIIPVATAGTVTPSFPGSVSITAICQPPSCNPSSLNQIGLFGNGTPVSSNPVVVTSPGTNSTLLYIASTQSRYLLPIDFTNPATGKLPVGPLPYAPNSMVISDDGSTIYMGSSYELMTFSATGNAISKQDTTVQGNVLAVSPDGTALIVSDPVRQIIYLYATSGSVASTYGGVATSAEFSPDSQTVYITTGTPNSNGTVTPGNTLLVHSSFTGWTSIALNNPTPNVAITVPSVGAYLAGSPTTAVSYCPSTTISNGNVISNQYYPPADSQSLATDVLAATNDGMHILGATVTNGPTFVDLSFPKGLPIGSCPTVVPNTYFTSLGSSKNSVAISGITATAMTGVIPTSTSSVAFVTYTGTGSLPAYTPSTGLITSIALSGSATAPVAGAISSDNSTLFVGTSGDNSVHLINVQTMQDQPSQVLVPNLPLYNTTTGRDNPSVFVTPNLVVQHPKKATS